MVSNSQPKPLVCVAHGGLDAEFVRRWTDELLNVWPGSPAPVIEWKSLAALLPQLELLGVKSPDESLLVLLAESRVSPIEVDRFVGAAAESGLPAVIVIKDAEAWRPLQRQGVLFVEPSTAMATVGAMCYALAERQAAVGMLAGEVRIAQRCQAGIRLEMERMHEELNLAASIQREFTSAPFPRTPGVEFGLLYRPMNFVSGDIYNVHALDDHRAAFMVADVVGHGVPAALLTMVLANSLAGIERAAATRGELSPAAVLSQLNARLCEMASGSGRFATAVYGVIDSRAGTVTFAGAGHPPPALLHDGRMRSLETNGPLLGVFEDGEFDEVTVTLADGDSLFVYTDGLDQAFARTETGWSKELPTFRIEQMFAALRRCDGDPLESMMNEVSSQLDAQIGSLHQSDDVTVLAIRRMRQAAAAAAAIRSAA